MFVFAGVVVSVIVAALVAKVCFLSWLFGVNGYGFRLGYIEDWALVFSFWGRLANLSSPFKSGCANVNKFGESLQKCLVNVSESGE